MDGVRCGMLGVAPQHFFDAFARSIGESDARFAEHLMKIEAAQRRGGKYPRIAEDS